MVSWSHSLIVSSFQGRPELHHILPQPITGSSRTTTVNDQKKVSSISPTPAVNRERRKSKKIVHYKKRPGLCAEDTWLRQDDGCPLTSHDLLAGRGSRSARQTCTPPLLRPEVEPHLGRLGPSGHPTSGLRTLASRWALACSASACPVHHKITPTECQSHTDRSPCVTNTSTVRTPAHFPFPSPLYPPIRLDTVGPHHHRRIDKAAAVIYGEVWFW